MTQRLLVSVFSWTTVAMVIAVVGLVASPRRPLERYFVIVGFVIQMGGLAAASYGIYDTLQSFKIAWFNSHWLNSIKTPPHISGSGGVTFQPFSVAGRAYVSSTIDPHASSETRLTTLTENVDYLSQRLIQSQNDFDAERLRQSAAVQQEADARSKDIADVNERLKEALTSGLWVSALGLVWVFFGTSVGTFAKFFAERHW